MVNKLIFRLGESIVLKKLKRTQYFVNNFRHFFSNAKDILVILPEKIDDINYALKIIEFLNSKNKKVYLYFNIDVTNYLHGALKYTSITYKTSDKTKIDLPSKDLLSKIEIIFFDVVIPIPKT